MFGQTSMLTNVGYATFMNASTQTNIHKSYTTCINIIISSYLSLSYTRPGGSNSVLILCIPCVYFVMCLPIAGKPTNTITTKGENINICWSPDGHTIAVGNKVFNEGLAHVIVTIQVCCWEILNVLHKLNYLWARFLFVKVNNGRISYADNVRIVHVTVYVVMYIYVGVFVYVIMTCLQEDLLTFVDTRTLKTKQEEQFKYEVYLYSTC